MVAGRISCPLIHYRIRNFRHKSARSSGESPLPYACIFTLVKEKFHLEPKVAAVCSARRFMREPALTKGGMPEYPPGVETTFALPTEVNEGINAHGYCKCSRTNSGRRVSVPAVRHPLLAVGSAPGASKTAVRSLFSSYPLGYPIVGFGARSRSCPRPRSYCRVRVFNLRLQSPAVSQQAQWWRTLS